MVDTLVKRKQVKPKYTPQVAAFVSIFKQEKRMGQSNNMAFVTAVCTTSDDIYAKVKHKHKDKIEMLEFAEKRGKKKGGKQCRVM